MAPYLLVPKNESDTQMCIEMRSRVAVMVDLVCGTLSLAESTHDKKKSIWEKLQECDGGWNCHEEYYEFIMMCSEQEECKPPGYNLCGGKGHHSQPGAYVNLGGKQRQCNEKRFVCRGIIGTKIRILAFNSYNCVVLRFHMQHLHLS